MMVRVRYLLLGVFALGCSDSDDPSPSKTPSVDPELASEGRDIFRFDTFGDESFWTDTLRMNEVIESAVDPTTALSVGLKVDARRYPRLSSRASRTARSASPIQRRRSRFDARRGSRREGDGRGGRRRRRAHQRGHHLRALPLDGGRLLRSRDRTTARRLSQPRPRSRRHHRALSGAVRRSEERLLLLGARQVRSSLQSRRRRTDPT